MITVVCSSQYPLYDFKEHVIKTSGLFNKIEFLGYENKGEFSLTEIYNRGLKNAKNDIIVFMHHDLTIDTKQWGNKLLKHFEKDSQIGIIGVAGTTYLPSSGQWWEDRSKMVGIVNHEHEGKKWESKYSDNLQNEIKETVIVDGLFIAIHKKRIKHPFDVTVKGFHFYDINFCFQNYLSGVKVGVITNIRITHKSIGITNEQWEENKKHFAVRYEKELPVKIKVKETDKLKILISCLFFKNFTGSELYVYELAKGLVKLGHDVTVLSDIKGPLSEIAKKQGIKVKSLEEPPGFKLGDGKWVINTPNGAVVSQPNILYKITDVNFDIIHVQHKPITEHILKLYPNIPKISTIHSEVIELENPVKHESIKKYVAIRPEIKEYISNKFDIDSSNIDIIYNPIDSEKFKPENTKNENSLLFVGTIDYLRKDTIYDLIEYTQLNNMELWLVGENKSDYLSDILINKHVKHFKADWNTQTYINKCKETAGILLGRTTIESWLCNKPSWIYNVDSNGNILDKTLHSPPSNTEQYTTKYVVEKIYKLYLNTLNS